MDAIAPEGGLPIPTPSNDYHHVLTSLGYPADAPPVADWLRRYHGLDGTWYVVSPIHWQATHNDAMIVACDQALDWSDEESRAFFAIWAECLQSEAIQLHYHDAYTWLIQPSEPKPIHALAVHALLQQPMMAHLKALDATLFWQRLLTENQMLFSAHALNHARKDRYPVNGVWIWGAGHLSTPVSRPIVCGDEASCALASVLSTQIQRYAPQQAYSKQAIFLSVKEEPLNSKRAQNHWLVRLWRSLIEN